MTIIAVDCDLGSIAIAVVLISRGGAGHQRAIQFVIVLYALCDIRELDTSITRHWVADSVSQVAGTEQNPCGGAFLGLAG